MSNTGCPVLIEYVRLERHEEKGNPYRMVVQFDPPEDWKVVDVLKADSATDFAVYVVMKPMGC